MTYPPEVSPTFPKDASDQSAAAGDRLKALYQTELMDSGPEERFDRLTRLVATTLSVPVALVSLVDTKRQFFKSTYGLPEPWKTERETPLTHSFCQHVVARAAPLVIDDAVLDPLVCDNLAIPELNVRAYLGIPLLTNDGYVLGSLCAIDGQPRKWTSREQEILADFGKLVEEQIALRERVEQLARFDEQRSLIQGELAHRIKNIFSVISSLLLVSSRTETDLDGFVRSVTGRIQALSKANDFIVNVGPASDESASGLAGLIDALLAPFKRDERQVVFSCPSVSVGEKTAAALALIIHELATNSAKMRCSLDRRWSHRSSMQMRR
ncbi:GAF domain-containing protein [Neorhizobium alkalisoli]|uniref:histidine kinase n=1 Tax=Neorhizobium alkalisoli TaxID=528178 RepID=A0A561PYX4_9HYPH|nr:GAF domain-containing protein [Neorhizobium alkalisoli]TWF43326.1 GAF domain-containing protein [Neorhizobium alkalisoli]